MRTTDLFVNKDIATENVKDRAAPATGVASDFHWRLRNIGVRQTRHMGAARPIRAAQFRNSIASTARPN